jgi:hypothetical protein
MNQTHRYRIAISCTALLLAACAAQSGGASQEESTEPTRPPFSAAPSSSAQPISSGAIGDVPAEMIAGIVADAAQRSGVAESDVEVEEATAMTWNDGSLGCPEPGQFYTQALVEGYHVIVVVDGERLDYRAVRGDGFRLCELPGAGGGSGND